MKIETKLSLNIAVPIATLLLILLAMTLSMNRHAVAEKKNAVALSLLSDIFDLAQQTDYYLLYQEDRAADRWYAIHDSMSAVIRGSDFENREQNTVIKRIERLLRELKSLFSRLTASEGQTTPLSPTFSKERRDRLSAQILERARYISSQALRLYRLSQTEMTQRNSAYDTLVVALLILSVIISVVTLLPINKSISDSVQRLIRGAQAVGTGNLDFRIGLPEKNELGQLAKAFDEMTGRLKVITISRDEMERRVRERTEELRRQAEMLNVTHDAIFVRGLKEEILFWNHGAEELYGWSSAEALGRKAQELLDTEPPVGTLAQITETTLKEGRWNGELRHRRKDGSTITVDSRWALQRSERGDPLAILETNNDITERKAATDALRKVNEELEQRVRARTAQLTERTAQLEMANRELESFSYSVSHDLRSPLRAIDGFSRMVLSDEGHGVDEETRRKLGIIRHNAVMMGQLIDDLLSFSRLGRTALKKNRFDITQTARDVVAEQTTVSPERARGIRLLDMPTAYGDPALIRQVLANLISNAVKFTRHSREPRIEIGGYEQEGETVYYVKDNGVGFDMKYYSKIFAVFQRLHGQDEFEGTGVGLAIVARIVQRHQGRVWAESEIGKGATFYFALPKKGRDSHE